MKKLLLVLLLIPTLSLNAMTRFTAVNQSNCTIKMNAITLEPHASKFICCAPNTEIKLEEVTTNPHNQTRSSTELIKPDTTLLTIDIERGGWEGWQFSTKQKASRPLTILNHGKLPLMLMLRRPEYGTWERDIPCPGETHTFITAPADTDIVEIYDQDASLLDNQKLSVPLHKDSTGISMGSSSFSANCLWARQLKFTKVPTEEDAEQDKD